MKAPSGVEPRSVRRFGDAHAGGVVLTGDHVVEVPLDHLDPALGTIEVYAREVRALDTADEDLPYLVFLQGGPGGRSPRPGVDGPGWIPWALERYRLILLDQRGTGRSTPQDRHTLAGLDPEAAARRLALFRADSIVDDCEVLRRHLLGDVPWFSLGQSFGGFCTWTYLSRAPQGLAASFVTGGIPPAGVGIDDIYRATYRAVERRTRALDEAHPTVRTVFADVARFVAAHDVRLPGGERLSVRRLQATGHILGMVNGIDTLAHLADDAWSVPGERLSDTFLNGVAAIVGFSEGPLYALVHEACYVDPAPGETVVTNWSAQRVLDELGVPDAPVTGDDGVDRLPLTGEMIYPNTFADHGLAGLAEVGEALAQYAWDRPLYDPARLAANTVPVAAAVYTQDMYVIDTLSAATAARTANVRVVLDEVHHHDGLRRAGAEVLGSLEAALGDAAARPAGQLGVDAP